RRRLGGEPVARIVGHKEFWGLSLKLSPATLVPRPDTETLVELALEIVRDTGAADRPLRIADLGTGSGAILLALLSELPQALGVGTDISTDALQTAEVNAARAGLADRASFVSCDYASGLSDAFDLIVSNPPYIRSGDIADLARADIGRIGHNEIERVGQAAGVIAADETGAIREPRARRVDFSGLQGVGRNVGADPEGLRQLRQQRQQDRAGAGAEIGYPQRAIGSAGVAHYFQRQFDQGFGIGPRHQRRRRKFQRQSPEFLVADNARDRLAGETASRE